MRVITIAEIKKACGGEDANWRVVMEYMMRQQKEDDYLILHMPEDYKSQGGIKVIAMLYCHEAWIIRQIGPATCIKHRSKETPFECWF